MPANVRRSWIGKVYLARNPSWTVHAEPFGPRANGQVKGLGVGGQQIIRTNFAITAIRNKDSIDMYGKEVVNGVETPAPAFYMQQNFPANLRKSPEQKIEERHRKLDLAHQSARAKWLGMETAPTRGRRMPLPGVMGGVSEIY